MLPRSFDTLFRSAQAFVFACVLGACRQSSPPVPPDHPAFFDKVYHRLDSVALPPLQAFHYLDSLYAAFPSPGILDRTRLYDYKGFFYFYHARDLPNTMRYVDSSLDLLSGSDARKAYPQQYARALINKGEVYQYQQDYDNALLYYFRGRQAMERLDDSCTMADYTQRLAMVSYRQRRFATARNFFGQALREYAACGPQFNAFAYVQSNLDNIGMCYAALGRWDSAAWYYDSTLSYLDKAGQRYTGDTAHRSYLETARAVVYGNQGDYSLHGHDTSRALFLYKESVDINLRPRHDSDNALSVLVKLAGLEVALNDPGDARTTLVLSKAVLDRRPSRDAWMGWTRAQAAWLGKTGDWRAAAAAQQAWMRAQDTINNTAGPIATVNFPDELQNLEDRYTIELLQQRDRVKTISLILIIPIVVLLFVIILLIRRGTRRSADYIQQLNSLNGALKTENQHTQLAINAMNETQAAYLQTLRVVAHDLRSPVGAISSAINLLCTEPGFDEETRMLLSLIQEASQQSLQLVGEVMRLDLPLGALHKEKVDLSSLLASCVSTLRFKASEKRQLVRFETEPITLYIDRQKIWRVIINLLDNAIKFSAPESDILLRSFRENGLAVITVTDKGIGIPKHLEAQLFTLENQGKRSGTAGESSFGLGLVIIRQIVQSHGGNITVDSVEDVGTTFRIELPIVSE